MSSRSHLPGGDPAAVVHVRGLRKTYPGGAEAVRGIDFDVAAGEVFGLLGPNGAGKSTTVGMLTTTIRPSAGSARLAGFDVSTEPTGARSVSSVVFQEPVVDKSLTGRRNMLLHARLWGVPAARAAGRIADLVAGFGLSSVVDRPVGSLSGGERRRLEIARALVSEPLVLFLDEPTVGLDTRIRHELLDLIGGLRTRTGMTTVLTTHYLDEADRLCDRIAIMHEGHIVACDRPSALLAGLGEEIIELKVDRDPSGVLAEMRAQGIADDSAFTVGSTLTVPVSGRPAGQAVGAIAGLGITAREVAVRPPTLDDVYLQLTGTRLTA